MFEGTFSPGKFDPVAEFQKTVHAFEMLDHRIESFIEILFSRKLRYPKRSKKTDRIFKGISRSRVMDEETFYRQPASGRKRKIIDRSSSTKKRVSGGRVSVDCARGKKSERANEARDKIKLKQCLPRHSLFIESFPRTLYPRRRLRESLKLYQRNYLFTDMVDNLF